MFQRALARELTGAAAKMPVVTVTGPRQSGKTTLVRSAFPDLGCVSLERPDERARVLADPLAFLSSHPDGAILDEVQRAPDLLSYVQADVDRDPRPGRFILTGSQNLLLMQGVSETLAGRAAILHLLPLSVAELFGRAPFDPRRLDEMPTGSAAPTAALWPTLWAGFYPRIHDQGLDADRWLADYRRTYVERDLRDVLNVLDLDAFDRFLRLAAARTGQELNLSELGADAGISQPTAKQWLTALRIGFLVTLVQPHHANFRKRLRKRPKLYFLDTGLVCHLLGIQSPAMLEHHPLRGAIFETFVAAELVKAFANGGAEAPLYHWRAAGGQEIDLLLDLGDRLLPIEVKSGQTITPDLLRGLEWWTALPGNHDRRGVLVSGGVEAFALRGMTVRPWFVE